MRIKGFVFTILLTISSYSFASDSLSDGDEIAVIGVGSHTCKQYLASLSNDNKYLYHSWAAGYATSFGHIVTKSNDFLVYYKTTSFSSDLKAYCTNNETVTFFDAVTYLIQPIVMKWIHNKKQVAK